MTSKQLSVFLENKPGKLGDVLRILKDNSINIYSISLADTSEYGLLRLIVNDPDAGRDALIENGYSSMIAEVLIIKIPHTPGSLERILEVIANKNISIEYMYGLSTEGKDAAIVIKTNNLPLALEILSKNGIEADDN